MELGPCFQDRNGGWARDLAVRQHRGHQGCLHEDRGNPDGPLPRAALHTRIHQLRRRGRQDVQAGLFAAQDNLLRTVPHARQPSGRLAAQERPFAMDCFVRVLRTWMAFGADDLYYVSAIDYEKASYSDRNKIFSKIPDI